MLRVNRPRWYVDGYYVERDGPRPVAAVAKSVAATWRALLDPSSIAMYSTMGGHMLTEPPLVVFKPPVIL